MKPLLNIFLKSTKGEVSYMMHIKTIKLSTINKTIIVSAIIIVITLFAGNVLLRGGVQAIASVDYKKYTEDICRIMINRTIPAVGIAMGKEKDINFYEFNVYTLFKYMTKIDLKNPRSYLSSQIPLLGLFDINSFSGNVEGTQGNSSVNNQPGTQEDRPPEDNFDNKPVDNKKIDITKPLVILYHTHTTESFTPSPGYTYEASGDHRTTDRNYNICRIGEEIKNYVETYYGFAVVHDMTLHDYPYYDGSYNRSKPTVENLIKKYPDAKYIIDVHRDAFPDREAARKNMVVDIRGEKAARIVFVIGKSNPHWQENYYMTLKLNQKIDELYPGLSKGILVKDMSIYNQDISNKMILLEMGADCNTIEEVLVSAKMVARAIGQLLSEN